MKFVVFCSFSFSFSFPFQPDYIKITGSKIHFMLSVNLIPVFHERRILFLIHYILSWEYAKVGIRDGRFED